MELTLETKVYSPSFLGRPEWTGILEAAFFPWTIDDSVTPELRRFNELMEKRGFDTETYGFEAGLATLDVGDLPYIFDNPFAQVAE